MNGEISFKKFIDDGETPVTVFASDFTRWTELCYYAEAHDMTISEAIVALVNSGLSHLPRPKGVRWDELPQGPFLERMTDEQKEHLLRTKPWLNT